MARCEMCGNDYDKSFELIAAGSRHVFDSFECAIRAVALFCEHCGCKMIGRGTEVSRKFFCCTHCASPSLRIIWREVHASRANRGLERLQIVYNNSGFAVTIQVKEAIERLLSSVHGGQGRLAGGTSGGTGFAGSGIEIGHFLNAVEGFD